MTTNMPVPQFSETWVTPLLRRWWIVVAVGVALIVLGTILLLNPFDAVRTLAVLVALGLAVAAADEVAQAERHTESWPSYVLAAIWFATAVLALLWPGVTLWALAVTVGIGLLVGGLAGVVVALRYRRQLPKIGVWLLDGALGIVLGIAALAWPGATIVALAFLLGLRILLRGIAGVMFGLALRQVNAMTSPNVPT